MDHRPKRVLAAMLAALSVLGYTGTVLAVPAFEAVPDPDYDSTNDNWSLGFQFTTNQPIVVSALGFYDNGQDGLVESHSVGIFDTSGSLLASAIVEPSDPLDGLFRYHLIDALTLPAGQDFIAAAVTGTEEYFWGPLSIAWDPSITFVMDRYDLTTGDNLIFPTSASGAGLVRWFGPNFQIGAAEQVIPEPHCLAILALGGLGLWRRRRKR
ncbi:MAG TPA: DUF4082 domain-containing protein [Planctomycetota bacterium]|nr:DUF4082 domain-containing protein [Planctomycetota bacterium]